MKKSITIPDSNKSTEWYIEEQLDVLQKKLESLNVEDQSNNEIEQKKKETLFDLAHSNYHAGNKSLRDKHQEALKKAVHNSAKNKSELAEIFMDIAKSHIELAEAEEAVQELKLQ